MTINTSFLTQVVTPWLGARLLEHLGIAAFAGAFAMAPHVHDLQSSVAAVGLGLGDRGDTHDLVDAENSIGADGAWDYAFGGSPVR